MPKTFVRNGMFFLCLFDTDFEQLLKGLALSFDEDTIKEMLSFDPADNKKHINNIMVVHAKNSTELAKNLANACSGLNVKIVEVSKGSKKVM